MPCLFCQTFCGDQSFCGAECYDAYEEARAKYLAQSECEALLNPEPKPFNEGFGDKGNS